MSHVETLGILDEIEALVSDKLQVVSYKWLSRNFLIPSNASKRLLQQFVERHRDEDGLQVLYALSGWPKNDPSSYHIKLASGSKLQEAKQEFDGNCSVHVYSVQACIPKDPAVLWNTEFVQAEELFNQPAHVDNCLRDNRFCGISNAFVKRHVDGTSNSFLKLNGARTSGPSINDTTKNTRSPASQQKTFQQSATDNWQASKVTKDVKGDSDCQVDDPTIKPSTDKDKVTSLPDGKKTSQNNKTTSAGGNSLANLWGRASTKSKPVPAENEVPEPQLLACEEAGEISDDEGQNVNFKRNNNGGEVGRKRRVVFDFSDEDEEFEDAVNLASPDFPKAQSSVASKGSTKELALEKQNLDTNEPKDNVKIVKQEKATAQVSKEPFKEYISVVRVGTKDSTRSSSKNRIHATEVDSINKAEVKNPAPTSPKRRKVLKTRIDERGREVSEVVWEGEETETKIPDSSIMKKAHNDSSTKTTDRPPLMKKSPAVGNTVQSNLANKTGNKKAGSAKDPKQGNILSFFKKV